MPDRFALKSSKVQDGMGLYAARRVKKVGDGRASRVAAWPGPSGRGAAATYHSRVGQLLPSLPPPARLPRSNFTSEPLCGRCFHFPLSWALSPRGRHRPLPSFPPKGASGGAAARGGRGAGTYPVRSAEGFLCAFLCHPFCLNSVGVSGAGVRVGLAP